MKHKVCIMLSDAYLKRKLELILSESAIFTDMEDADVIFTEVVVPSHGARAVTVGRGSECALRVPFSDADAIGLLPNTVAGRNGLSVVGNKVYLGEDEIRFTDLERSLFMKLYEAGGEFVTRAELCSVFTEGSSESMLNVYIHYLREKLELDGVRVILSSRKHGYKIDEKFFQQGGV